MTVLDPSLDLIPSLPGIGSGYSPIGSASDDHSRVDIRGTPRSDFGATNGRQPTTRPTDRPEVRPTPGSTHTDPSEPLTPCATIGPSPEPAAAAPAPKLRVLILCGRSPRHLYVANALCEAGEVLAIVHETGSEWNVRKVKRLLHPDTLTRKAWRWLRDRRRYLGNAESRFFFGEQTPRLMHPELVAEVPHINHPALVALATQLQPDLIAVFGTSLIRGELLGHGRLGIANLHGGLSPEYRGADCTFWALYNGEPDKVGCTLHWIDAGIDTGGLIAHVRPEVGHDDDELTLFWRAVRDSAAVYAELVRRLAAGERFGQAQPTKGRLYQVKDRGLRHERSLAKRLRTEVLGGEPLERRVRWFEKDD